MEQIQGYYDDRNFQRGLELPLHFFKIFSTQFLVEMLTAILHALHYDFIGYVPIEMIQMKIGGFLASNLSYECSQVKQINLQYAGNQIMRGSQI